MIDPLINILIRTGNSPKGFDRAYQSVLHQDYENIQVFASVDSELAREYVESYAFVKPVFVERKQKNSQNHSPYNAYLNPLFKSVKDGWIFILDDDDYVCRDDFFKTISGHMTSPHNLIFWKMRMESGRVIPEPEYFKKDPVVKHIGMPCFTFHSYYKDLHTFDEGRRADFKLVSSLYPKISNKIWIDEVFIQLGNNGRHGKI